MTADNIEEVLNRTPFAPFELQLDNGRTLHVKHPDFLMFTEDKRTVIVTEGARFIIADLDPCQHDQRGGESVGVKR